MKRGVWIIVYHDIGASCPVLSTPPHVFQRQLDAWAERGVVFLSLGEVASILNGTAPAPNGPAVVFTFDDALESVYTRAFPILRERGIPAAVFAVAGYMGRTNRWPGQPAWVPEMKIMTWDQARELSAGGVEFGAHTLAHPDLTTVDPSHVQAELVDSRRMIEDELQVEVRSFAYPYGRSNESVRRVVDANYPLGLGLRMRPLAPGDPRGDLPRLDAYYLKAAPVYPRLGTSAFAAYLRLRAWAREIKSRR
jgi:peptidoglycan/xylan/chitin deacetylase (PgdA/CDA1 family)